MTQDWTGDDRSIYARLGATNHSRTGERAESDYYATDPESLQLFLYALANDDITLNRDIWECAAGNGVLSQVLKRYGYRVKSSDIYKRGYRDNEIIDFLEYDGTWDGDILTNPPYSLAQSFVEKALQVVKNGAKVIMYLHLQFLETKSRRELFDNNPPKYIYVNSARQACYKNGDTTRKMSSAVCYCWFIWEKGYQGEPIIRWI